MKFSVGDPVYIKTNQEEGVIIEIIDRQTAKVKANGTVYHAFFEDLDHPYLNWFLRQNKEKKGGKIFIDQIQTEKTAERKKGLLPGVSLVCFPQYRSDDFDEEVSQIKLYFYNETSSHFQFSYAVRQKTESWFELDSEVLPDSSFYLHDLSFEQMASTPHFRFRFTDTSEPQRETEFTLVLKPKKLFEHLDRIKYENQAFFVLLLFEHIEIKPIKKVEFSQIKPVNDNAEKRSHFDFSHALNKTRYEVDLHIEKLIGNTANLTKAEKLHIQLTEFSKALELASITHQRSIVFIHGVGKGTLKAEIHKILSSKKQTKQIRDYVNNYDTRYGFGATEVFLL